MPAPLRPPDTFLARARVSIHERGLLLLADASHPSLATLVAGEPVRGSWWGHPAGKDIFDTASRLDDDPDVLSLPFLAGKVTFVDRRLFAPLLAVATEGAAWQRAGLGDDALRLLTEVETAGEVRVAAASRKAGGLLERRLLVLGGQVHTASGAHAKVLRSWARVAAERGIPLATLPPPDEARALLESSAHDVSLLPWSGGGRRSGRRTAAG